MDCTVLAFQLLLDCGQLAKGRRNVFDNKAGKAIPSKGQQWSLPSYELSQFFAEQNNVENWLDCVEVQTSETGRPLLGVVGQALVRVCNSIV